MALAALKAGAHVYLEKPITQTLAEADDLISCARESGLKIAVAHQMRLAPNLPTLKSSIDQGLIGELDDTPDLPAQYQQTDFVRRVVRIAHLGAGSNIKPARTRKECREGQCPRGG
jgi:predicted dehydrogenase